ncbi:MAG: DUF3592 domain-containing protein [Defluviitaleaceae bacterium]|nr:DUF3592 domain-containing protein [Defluviitaleaceae bacterium]
MIKPINRSHFTGFDSEKSKGFFITCVVLALILSIAATILHIRDAHAMQNFEQVSGVVTESFNRHRDERPAFSVIQFEFEGQLYTVHRYNTRLLVGSSRELMVDANNPQNVVFMATNPVNVPDVLWGIAAFFGAGAVFWLIIFLVCRKRERK